MKTIIITGPSGSGKTFLTHKLSNLFDDSIVIKTDAYYKDNILIRFLSIFLYDIYDRVLSIKKNELKNILISIYNKERIISFRHYDFKRKQSSISQISINYKGEKQFLILEGIFSHRLELNYQETINIVCEGDKEICYERRLKRDKIERGRNNNEVTKKFNRSWNLYYRNTKYYLKNNQVICLNPLDNNSYNNLVLNLQKIYKTNQEK